MKHMLRPLVSLVVALLIPLVACSDETPNRIRSYTQALTADAWNTGANYQIGERVSYNGNVYECLQAHSSQAGWNPQATPALWELIGIDDGVDAGGTGGTTQVGGTGGTSQGGGSSLSPELQRVLGFEDPEADWTPTNGAQVSRVSSELEGEFGLAIGGQTWTRLESVPVHWEAGRTIHTIGFDVMVPTPTPEPGWWGSVSLLVLIPSAGVTEWVGQQGLDETALNRFRRAEFQLSQTLRAALSQGHNDVTFQLDVSMPAGVAPYVIDRLSFQTEEAQEIPGIAPSADIDRILSMDSLGDWSSSSGTPSLGTDPTDGAASFNVSGATYTDILNRVRISSLGDNVTETLSIDVKLAASDPNPYWRGSLGLTIHLPSQGINWKWIAAESLQTLSPGVWGTVQFSLPPDVVTALRADYSDLQLKFSLSIPAAPEAYEIDNIELGQPRMPRPSGDFLIQVPLPEGAGLDDIAIAPALPANRTTTSPQRASNLEHNYGGGLVLSYTDVINPLGGYAGVADRPLPSNWGDYGFAPHLTHSNVGSVWSTTGLYLDHQSTVHGDAFLRAPTNRFPTPVQSPRFSDVQTVGQVLGSTHLDQRLAWADVASWWVSGVFSDVAPVPNAEGVLPPGNYGALNLLKSTPLTLVAGEYSFRGFNLGIATHLILDNSEGPIIIRNDGPLQSVYATSIRVVERSINNIAIVHLSTNTARLYSNAEEHSWQALVLAPNAYVRMPRSYGTTQFAGAIYSKGLELDNAVITHVPFSRPDCSQARASCVSLFGCERIDTDRDSLADCEEERDQNPWTDPEVFNGVQAFNGFPVSKCHHTVLHECTSMDERSEVQECLDPGAGDVINQYAGWVSEETFTQTCGTIGIPFAPHFNDCGSDLSGRIDWGMYASAQIYLAETGRHCFRAESTDGGCGTLFFNSAETGTTYANGTKCFNATGGVYPIEWFLSGGDAAVDVGDYYGGHYSLNYCFDATEDCVATLPIPLELLRPTNDGEGPCLRDEDCGEGLSCGNQNGAHFGLPRDQNVCWSQTLCEGPSLGENCGHPGAACGLYCDAAQPCSDESDCAWGESCSDNAPFALGLDHMFQRVCWSDECVSGTSNCGTSEALCGSCTCEPTCEEMQCGESSWDGCNGQCLGACASGATGCIADADCPSDHRCLGGAGAFFGTDSNETICVPETCLDAEFAGAECGYEGALCGDLCPTVDAACQGMECGTDPRNGEACGTCDNDTVCTLQNTCSSLPPGPPPLPPFSMAYEVGAMAGAYATTPTGKATYSIPLRLPPGAGGIEPKLEFIFHDTSNVRGPLGPGWSLAGMSRIHRCSTPGAQDLVWQVRHQQSLPDSYCLDGQPLIFSEDLTEQQGNLGVEVYQVADDMSRKIVFNPVSSQFMMFTSDGRTHRFGITENSKRLVYDGPGPLANLVPSTWFIAETKDRFGNSVEYNYLTETRTWHTVKEGQVIALYPAGNNLGVYPDYIRYSKNSSSDFGRKIQFHYIEKNDPVGRSIGYEHHAENVDNRLLDSITVDTFDGQSRHESIRSYHLEYGRSDSIDGDGLMRVEAIRECAKPLGQLKCLPPTTFTYDDPQMGGDQDEWRRFGEQSAALEETATLPLNVRIDGKYLGYGAFDRTSLSLPLDADGDGIKDLLAIVSEFGKESYRFLRGQISEGSGFSFADPVNVVTNLKLRAGCLSPASVVDLDGDGREEIVDGCPLERDQRYLAFFRLSADGELTEHRTNKPAFGRVHVADIDGNGRPDFVQDIGAFILFGDFGAYDGGIMQVELRSVLARGDKSPATPLFLDVDGDGVANFLRFDESTKQFLALGFSPDSEADEVTTTVIPGPDGSNVSIINLAATWRPTLLSYEWDPLPNGGHGNRDTARVLDINGDGLQDVWIQHNTFNAPLTSDPYTYKLSPFPIVPIRTALFAANIFNGMAGWGYHAGDSDIWLNRGGTFTRMKAILASIDGRAPRDEECAELSNEGCRFISNQHIFRNSTVLDYDQDGREELVMVSSDVQARFHVVEENAYTLRLAISSLHELGGDAENSGAEYIQAGKKQRLSPIPTWADFDGDGNLDVLVDRLSMNGYSEAVPQISSRLDFYSGQARGRGRRLETITDGLGNHLKIDRALAREVVDLGGNCGRDETEFGNQPRCLRRLGPMVARVNRGTIDGEHFGSTSYTYSHPATADFLQGYFFAEKTISEENDQVGSDSLPEIVSTTREEYADALKNSAWHDAQTYPFLYAPTTRETTLTDAPDLSDELRGRTLLENRNYRFEGNPGVAYMHERYVRVIDETESGEETTKTVEELINVDVYGLHESYSRKVYAGSSWPTVSEYEVTSVRDADRERWILDKFERVTETVNGKSESFYYEHDDDTGFITQMTKLNNTERQLITVYTPDAFGNVATMTENGERLTQFDYGDSGIFLHAIQNAEGHTQTFGYDDALGMQTEHRDENGYRLHEAYDGFGRLVLRELDNNGTKTVESNIRYSAVSPTEVDGQSIQSRIRLTVSSDYYSGEGIKEFDSRGLLVKTRDPGLGINGATPNLVTEKIYDWAGRLTRSSQAHLESASPDWTRISYDERGRQTRVRSPQGEFWYEYAAHTQYQDDFPEWMIDEGLELIHVTDSEDVERVLVTDEKGRKVLTADGVDLANGDTGLISKVIYGDWDLPERLIDPELNETINGYTDDRLLKWTEDANRGRTEWTYDVYGNAVSELTADGIQSEFTYDSINRPLTRVDHLPDGNETTEWEYDLDVPGTLSEMTGPTGIKTEFGYEDGARALQTSARYVIDGEAFDTETEYDPLGRVNRVSYPNISVGGTNFGFAVRHTYDAHSGHLTEVLSDDETTPYWAVEDVDHASQSTSVRLGNGVLEERKYDPASRRITNIRTLSDSGDELSTLSYQYYSNGQMLDRSFSHGESTDLRSFTYDAALRLKTIANDEDVEELEFSASGRLLSRTKYGGYAYDATQPHALTSVGDNEFAYDDRGNQYLRMGPDIPGTTQTTKKFSRFNLPVQVEVGDPATPDETLAYEYDASGRRVIKRAEMSNVEVLTPGDLYQRQSESEVTVLDLHTFRVFAGGTEILQVQYDEGTDTFEYKYLHRDHLSSVLYATNEGGEQGEVRDFDVFGAALSEPSWAGNTEEAFTGHKVDQALGLLEAGVRMYDPKFGVFTTPDSIRVSGEGSQAFNPFAYANNDPVNWYDPTGFQGEPSQEIDEDIVGIGHGWSTDDDGSMVTISFGVSDGSDYSGTLDTSLPGPGYLPSFARGDAKPYTGMMGEDNLHNTIDFAETHEVYNDAGMILTTSLEIASLRGLVVGIFRGAMRYLSLAGAAKAAPLAGNAAKTALHRMQLAAEQAAGARMPVSMTGYTKHGLNQAISREGVGVGARAISDAVANPLKISGAAGKYGGEFTFVGRNATAVLNESGKLITTWANNSAGVRAIGSAL